MIKRIIHLSDLHFGTERTGLVGALMKSIRQLNADMIIISGDLTQRALESHYEQAHDFLENLKPHRILCVPGNHDISLHNLVERFFFPYDKYKKYINEDLCPNYSDDKIAILGINSATPYLPIDGYITEEQMQYIFDYFDKKPNVEFRILIMHHNLISSERHMIINRAKNIIASFASSRVNLVLSGHIHAPCIERINESSFHNCMYIITAGTAISRRTELPNSFNVIDIGDNEFTLSVHEFSKDSFVITSEHAFKL